MELPFLPTTGQQLWYLPRKDILSSFLILAFSFQKLNSRQVRVRGWGSPSSILPPRVKWRLYPGQLRIVEPQFPFLKKLLTPQQWQRVCQGKEADQKNREIKAFPRKLIWETDMWSPDMLHWLSKSLFIGWKKNVDEFGDSLMSY